MDGYSTAYWLPWEQPITVAVVPIIDRPSLNLVYLMVMVVRHVPAKVSLAWYIALSVTMKDVTESARLHPPRDQILPASGMFYYFIL